MCVLRCAGKQEGALTRSNLQWSSSFTSDSRRTGLPARFVDSYRANGGRNRGAAGALPPASVPSERNQERWADLRERRDSGSRGFGKRHATSRSSTLGVRKGSLRRSRRDSDAATTRSSRRPLMQPVLPSLLPLFLHLIKLVPAPNVSLHCIDAFSLAASLLNALLHLATLAYPLLNFARSLSGGSPASDQMTAKTSSEQEIARQNRGKRFRGPAARSD